MSGCIICDNANVRNSRHSQSYVATARIGSLAHAGLYTQSAVNLHGAAPSFRTRTLTLTLSSAT